MSRDYFDLRASRERGAEQACWKRRRDGALFAHPASLARRASSRALCMKRPLKYDAIIAGTALVVWVGIVKTRTTLAAAASAAPSSPVLVRIRTRTCPCQQE